MDNENQNIESSNTELQGSNVTFRKNKYSKELVQSIIQKRKKTALLGLTIANGVIVFVALRKASSTDSLAAIFIIFIIMNIILGTLFIINSLNSSDIKSGYRLFNKVFYVYLSIFAVIFGILNILGNILSISNPMHGFKNPDALSKSEIAIDTAVSVGVASEAAAQISPAKYIEGYFKEITSNN